MKFIFISFLIITVNFYNAVSQQKDLPNIIMILADDITAEDIGCYGNSGIKTPNIDALAEGGIIFKNGFVPISSCAASRASIMLGRYPHSTGMAELKTCFRSDKKEIREFVKKLDFMAKDLQNAGYYTLQSGKWHIGGLYDWAKPDGIFKEYFDSAEPVDLYNDGGAYRWIELLKKRPKDKPFFCWYSTFDAHRTRPRLHDAEDPPYMPRTWNAPRLHDVEDVSVPPYMPEVDSSGYYNTREDLAQYYDAISRLDSYVGKIIEELKEQNVYDNTLIVLLADNGRCFIRSKVNIYDSGVRIPFIVHWPKGITNPGTVSESLVSSIDLAPTFLELTGGDVNRTTYQGRSLVHLLVNNPKADHHPYIFTERNHHIWEAHERGVRDKAFLYIRNRRPDIQRRGSSWEGDASMFILRNQLNGQPMHENYSYFFERCQEQELYDVNNDPDMMNNLANLPEYKKELKRMQKVLAAWEKQTGDDAPGNMTKHFWDGETWGYPKLQIPKSELIGKQPGWEHLKKITIEQVRKEASVTRNQF